MIRGRATAGDSHTHVPLAARPEIVRPLSRSTLGVGLAALAAALVLGGGEVLVRSAAEAAVIGGGYGSGRDAGSVAGLSSSEAAAVAIDAPVTAALPSGLPAVPADLAPVAPPPEAAPVVPPVAAPAAPPPPAPAPAPAPAPDPGSVEAVIVEVFGPAHGQAAIGVARCESGLNPSAVSRGGGNWGLFQINTVHRKRVAAMGYQWEDLLDARVNSLVARSIFVEQGWQPWGCRHAAG